MSHPHAYIKQEIQPIYFGKTCQVSQEPAKVKYLK